MIAGETLGTRLTDFGAIRYAMTNSSADERGRPAATVDSPIRRGSLALSLLTNTLLYIEYPIEPPRTQIETESVAVVAMKALDVTVMAMVAAGTYYFSSKYITSCSDLGV
jgi:hypothetical protein